MRVAVAGAGKVGRAIARELVGNGHEVLLIDKDAELLDRAVLTPVELLVLQGRLNLQKFANLGDEDGAEFLLSNMARNVSDRQTSTRDKQIDVAELLFALFVIADERFEILRVEVLSGASSRKDQTFF